MSWLSDRIGSDPVGGISDAWKSAYGDFTGENGMKKAAQSAEYTPFGVTTGLGSVGWNGTNATFNMDPRYKALQDTLFGNANKYLTGQDVMSTTGNNIFAGIGGSNGMLARALAYDPEASSRAMYDKLTTLARPGEEKAVTGLENTLYKRGMLGSTGGAGLYGEMMRSLQDADLKRSLDSRNQAVTEQSALLNNLLGLTSAGGNLLSSGYSMGNGMFNMGKSIDDATLNQIMAGANIGGLKASADATKAALLAKGSDKSSDFSQSLLSMGLLAMSDRRLKTNIQKVGFNNGLTVYSFNYVWGSPTQIGYMADEVEQLYPEAVVVVSGFKAVDYGKVGV